MDHSIRIDRMVDMFEDGWDGTRETLRNYLQRQFLGAILEEYRRIIDGLDAMDLAAPEAQAGPERVQAIREWIERLHDEQVDEFNDFVNAHNERLDREAAEEKAREERWRSRQSEERAKAAAELGNAPNAN